MKAFIVTAGIIFALLLVAHVARFMAEGARLFGEPVFIATTFGSFAMCAWAATLLLRKAS